MALAPRLDFRQSQQLVMTPQLQQAIKLLQLSSLDLKDFVAEEIEKNPLLEARDPGSSDGEGQARNLEEPQMNEGSPGEPEVATSDVLMRSSENLGSSPDAPLDADLGVNVFNNDTGTDGPGAMASEQMGYSGYGAVGGSSGEGGAELEQRLQAILTLKDHFQEQLKGSALSPQQRLIAVYLIDLVDDAGYLPEDLSDVNEQLGCESEDLAPVLAVLQDFEPAGVFARDLKECLTLQLKEKNRFDPCMAALVENLSLLGKRDLPALKRLCRVSDEDLMDMIAEIRALDPKPGFALSGGEPSQLVIPDVFVKKNRAGIWVVELNSDTLPKVLLNRTYYAELASLKGSKADKAFVSECYSNASWLVKALDQRAKTILKVAGEIVKQQETFFDFGVRHLKPLNLRTIADAIEMHESTVSRVTANKYMATHRGIFELKYFFTTAIAATGGDSSHSSESVRHRMRELIDLEDSGAILSDDKIVDILRMEGIDIARRTVAKYREAMRIPSSVQRRRQKRIKLS